MTSKLAVTLFALFIVACAPVSLQEPVAAPPENPPVPEPVEETPPEEEKEVQEPIAEPEEETTVFVPVVGFHFIIDDYPKELIPGDRFSIRLAIENTGNVVLEPANSHVNLLFAHPPTIGLKSITEMRRSLSSEIEAGETGYVTFDLAMDPEYKESSSIMFEFEFCYDVSQWHDECTVTRQAVPVNLP